MLTYPAPERNKAPVLELLQRILPVTGTVLEVASGTGQHIVHFAASLPGLRWQPSDPESAHREAVQARIDSSGLANVARPLDLDVLKMPWAVDQLDAILCINMVHISPWAATLALLDEAGRLLPPDAPLYLYGPFRRSGHQTAPSNEAFDADLRQRNPEWGLRTLEDVTHEAAGRGLALVDVVQMPANNLSVIFRRAPR